MTFEPSPEFSRIIRADQLADHDTEFPLQCDPTECARLAKRFSLQGLERLDARVWARRIGGTPTVRVRVNFTADVIQSCIVTLEPVAAHIDEWFEVEYVPGNDLDVPNGDKEVVFDAEEDDPPEVMQGGAFDIGEAISEHLALSLDNYPRKPGAEFTDHSDEGEMVESPFTILKDPYDET